MDFKARNKNYRPKSMSFSAGFYGPRGNVGFLMKVDNDKAQKIVKELLKSGKQIRYADLGLDGDFNENSTEIFDGTDFYNYDAHDASMWAVPILMVYYSDGSNECYECWYKEIEV